MHTLANVHSYYETVSAQTSTRKLPHVQEVGSVNFRHRLLDVVWGLISGGTSFETLFLYQRVRIFGSFRSCLVFVRKIVYRIILYCMVHMLNP